jgi:Protein of unknown function (DUF3761)
MTWRRLRLVLAASALAGIGLAGCGSGGRTTGATACANGTYVNRAGDTVCRPQSGATPPAGATARCGDGTYSFSESSSGACSHHGGVAESLPATTAAPPSTVSASVGCCDALGHRYDPNGITGPRPPNLLPANETAQGYDRAWYCKHPPDPDGTDRSGSAYCSGQATATLPTSGHTRSIS